MTPLSKTQKTDCLPKTNLPTAYLYFRMLFLNQRNHLPSGLVFKPTLSYTNFIKVTKPIYYDSTKTLKKKKKKKHRSPSFSPPGTAPSPVAPWSSASLTPRAPRWARCALAPIGCPTMHSRESWDCRGCKWMSAFEDFLLFWGEKQVKSESVLGVFLMISLKNVVESRNWA